MTTIAALGDSITLGVGDPAPGGGWRGWAAFLAQSLPGGQLVNLAATGARAADVERVQLPRALELRPDVASVIVGTNDILRAGFDAPAIQAAIAHVIGSLSAAGAVVLTMRLPDPGQMLRMPSALARPLVRRLQVINEAMDEAAERFGTLHFDVTAEAVAYDRRMWSADRLHPSERGHRYIAGYFHDRLAAHGQLVGPRPAAEPTSPPPTWYEVAAWMATKGTAWVLRRSTDLLPYLLVMALRECWPGAGPQAQPPAPRTAEPAATEPAATEPAAALPPAAEPAATELAATELAATELAATELAAAEPAAALPPAAEPGPAQQSRPAP